MIICRALSVFTNLTSFLAVERAPFKSHFATPGEGHLLITWPEAIWIFKNKKTNSLNERTPWPNS